MAATKQVTWMLPAIHKLRPVQRLFIYCLILEVFFFSIAILCLFSCFAIPFRGLWCKLLLSYLMYVIKGMGNIHTLATASSFLCCWQGMDVPMGSMAAMNIFEKQHKICWGLNNFVHCFVHENMTEDRFCITKILRGDWLLQIRLAVDDQDKPTVEACGSVLQSAVRNSRYLLKKKYFNGIPADQVRTTSPVPSLTDEQWLELVKLWSSPKAKVSSWCKEKIMFYLCCLQFTDLPYRKLLRRTKGTVLRSGTIKRRDLETTSHTCTNL